jgi:hypothetical protein
MSPGDKDGQAPQENRYDRSSLRNMEDELRDPKNFLEYFLPRPLRLVFFGASAASCLVAALLATMQMATSMSAAVDRALVVNLAVDAVAFLTFLALFNWDSQQQRQRVEQRARLRKTQIEFGDRCIAFQSAHLQGHHMFGKWQVSNQPAVTPLWPES